MPPHGRKFANFHFYFVRKVQNYADYILLKKKEKKFELVKVSNSERVDGLERAFPAAK